MRTIDRNTTARRRAATLSRIPSATIDRLLLSMLRIVPVAREVLP